MSTLSFVSFLIATSIAVMTHNTELAIITAGFIVAEVIERK